MKTFNIIFLIILFVSCTPEAFRLNMKSDAKLINTVIIGDLNNVEQINDNSFIVKNGGKTSLRVLGNTQSEMKFELEFLESDFARFGIRTTRVNYNPKNDIILEIKGNDISLYQYDKLLVNKRIAKSEKKSKLIKIFNLGDDLKISIDCIEIINMRTKLPVTEYLIVECNKNSTIKLSGIVFDLILLEKNLNF
jgi:hypothetical protein